MFGTTKKDPLVDAVAKVMKENETRRQVECSLNDEIGIYSRNVLTSQQKPEYERVLAERTAIALNEELKGNQTKIDANHNGKVDGQDFKILKAKKGQMEEENESAEKKMEKGEESKEASSMEEEVEQINEIGDTPKGRAALGSYVKKASHDVATKSAATGRYAERANKVKDETKKGDYSNYQQGKKDDATADKMFNKSWKRREGIAKAVDKMTKEDIQIDEVLDSKMKKLSYVMKAKKSIKNSDPKDIKQANDIANRVIGVKRVMKKLTKEGAELDEAKYSAKAGRAGEDLGKPGKNFEKIAAKAGKEYGSAESGKKVAGAILAKMRAKHMKENTLDESAPPGAKYERMVKHIKKKYSKDGLTDKEKSIAYATAWKAKNKDSE